MCGCQPDDVVGLPIEPGGLLVGLVGVFPEIPVRLVEKERRIAGVFRVDIDFTGLDGVAHNARAAQLQAILDRNSGVLQRLQNHLAQHGAFGINLRRHHHGIGGHRRRGDQHSG